MLRIDYIHETFSAALSWDVADENSQWLTSLKTELTRIPVEVGYEGFRLVIPWWAFVGARNACQTIFRTYGLTAQDIAIGPEAAQLLRRATAHSANYDSAAAAVPLDAANLIATLASRGFIRELKEPQLNNVCKLAPLPAGATFSVPGAGKTTEALAFFFARATPEDHLLVVAPKNAFAAWDEQLTACVPEITESFVRLRGGQIEALLGQNPRFAITSYQQFNNSRDIIAQHIARHQTFVFLDESHRIKGGMGRSSARAILETSFLPIGKLVMSGTPMPQSREDMIPQFQFLYPEVRTNSDNVIDYFGPIYVRTKKSQLDIPEPNRVIKSLPMRPVQSELYRLMRSEVARQASQYLTSRGSKSAMRRLGRSVARLLQFVSNPPLLSGALGFAEPDLLRQVIAEGDGPKMAYVLRRARELVRDRKKVLIWSSFVENVNYLASRLSDVGAVYIHGSVDAGSDDDIETREGKIKAFHDRDDVMVLVANPAAAAEGISLHKVCYHALYLDRTFNAAHYLQSEDRIHRIGQEHAPQIEIVECVGTVDEMVRTRLNIKIEAMGRVLNDESLLSNLGIAFEQTPDVDETVFNVGLEATDIALLAEAPTDDL